MAGYDNTNADVYVDINEQVRQATQPEERALAVARRGISDARSALGVARFRLSVQKAWKAVISYGITVPMAAFVMGGLAAIVSAPIVLYLQLQPTQIAISMPLTLVIVFLFSHLFMYLDGRIDHEARVREKANDLDVAIGAEKQAAERLKKAVDYYFDIFIEHERQIEEDRRNSQRLRLESADPDNMAGHEFEEFLAEVFQFLGYGVVNVGSGGHDHGADLIVTKDGQRTAIQAKCHAGTIGNGAVQEAYTAARHYGCRRCAVVTNSTFTPSAIDLSMTTGCILVNGTALQQLIAGEIDF